MATTTNFGWETPDDTDLVKDGALAIRTLGSAIDTSLVDLKGGTTGQVLSKTSNTDMDFTWVTSDDANAIQNTIVDAKGDLISASAADVPARLAVGNNGETLVADSSASTGLRWQGDYAAGKNKIINGDMSIWQRGTTFNSAANGSFTADRYQIAWDASPTVNASQQTFTPGTAPQAGYESAYFLRVAETAVGGSTVLDVRYRIEDVRTFAGQTATLSFWAKADSTRTLTIAAINQDFGSGGSTAVGVTPTTSSFTLTTSWQRFSTTMTFPSIAGKTIGTNSLVSVFLRNTASASLVFDLWGVQWEQGSVATAFQTATGTLAGERSACERYYCRFDAGSSNYVPLTPLGLATATTSVNNTFQFPVTMRVAPSGVDGANLSVYGAASGGSAGFLAVSAIALTRASTNIAELTSTVTGASLGGTYRIQPNNAAGYVAFSAEL